MEPQALAHGVTIEREIDLDPDTAARFAEIYEASFPAEERDETANLITGIAAGERFCFLARRDRVVVGLAIVFSLDGPPVAFLEYLAVAPDERNAGIGGSMLAHLAAHLKAEGGVAGVVLEVDPPDAAENAGERTLRERRIDFYVRHGAAVAACAPRYRAPSLNRDDETVPFTLLWLPLADYAPAALAGAFLRRTVEAILTQSYELAHDDPLVREVVDDLVC